MQTFPETWLPVIGKHLRRHLGLSPDAPLPESAQRRLQALRAAEIARLGSLPA